jgi:hypothetical protein
MQIFDRRKGVNRLKALCGKISLPIPIRIATYEYLYKKIRIEITYLNPKLLAPKYVINSLKDFRFDYWKNLFFFAQNLLIIKS